MLLISSLGGFISQIAILAPNDKSLSVVDKPIPEDPPVTIMDEPEICIFIKQPYNSFKTISILSLNVSEAKMPYINFKCLKLII